MSRLVIVLAIAVAGCGGNDMVLPPIPVSPTPPMPKRLPRPYPQSPPQPSRIEQREKKVARLERLVGIDDSDLKVFCQDRPE